MVDTTDAGLIEITTRPSTGDIIDWRQLEASGGGPTPVSTPQDLTSTSGVQGTVNSDNGIGSVWVNGGNFLGNFAPGDRVFYTGTNSSDVSGSLTLTFDTPVSTVGAQIDMNTYGAFTAQ